MFVELMPLLKQRTLLITVARIDEKLKVNVIPAKAKEGKTRRSPRLSVILAVNLPIQAGLSG
jgi:hypothetical protein